MSENRFLDPNNHGNNPNENSIVSLDILRERNKHQKALQTEQHAHDLEILNKKMGVMGRFFGIEDNSSKNITALICCLLITFCLGGTVATYLVEKNFTFAKWMWGQVFPFISLAMGYLFGKK